MPTQTPDRGAGKPSDVLADRKQLESKLCHELSQSEHSALAQPRREARRLGDTPPGDVLRGIAAHARAMRPRLDALLAHRSSRRGMRIGALFGELFSLTRHLFADRLIDTERSYRGTLLGLDHGADLVRMLAAIAALDHDHDLAVFCQDWLAGRLPLLERARNELAWFVREPAVALATPR